MKVKSMSWKMTNGTGFRGTKRNSELDELQKDIEVLEKERAESKKNVSELSDQLGTEKKQYDVFGTLKAKQAAKLEKL